MNGHVVIALSYLGHAFKSILSTPSIFSQDNQRMDRGPVDGGPIGLCRKDDSNLYARRIRGELLGSRWSYGAAALNRNRLNRGKGGRNVKMAIAILILAISPDTIHHVPLLVDQHGETGKGIVVGLSGLCETCEDIPLLRPSSNPDLQARQTKSRIGLHDPSDVGIP